MKNQSLVKYQLRSGRTVFITLDQYLDMTDEFHQQLEASGKGVFIEDVFADFDNTSQNTDQEEIIELEELPEDIRKEIEDEFSSDQEDQI